MARRLFHAIVLVGTGMGAACASRDAPASLTDGATAETTGDSGTKVDGELDSFPGIMPMRIDSAIDTNVKTDSFPTIAVDTSVADTGAADGG